MEENKSKKEEENKKPLNIILLGDASSEKEKLVSKLLLSNSKLFLDNDLKKEEDKEEDKSLLQNIIYNVEMHGEKIKMKLWDNPAREEFLSPSIKIAQGILLFYSIKNKESFLKIKENLSKIIELGKFDIPIVIIGNHSDTNDREVSFEEAKSFSDNYGLRFYETSNDNNITIKQILQDMGEQLLFQECINTANNSKIEDNLEDDNLNLDENLNIGELIKNKNKESENRTNSNKEIENSKKNLIPSFSEGNIFNSNQSIKKIKSNKQISKFSLFNNSSSNLKKKNHKIISLKSNKNSVNKSGSLILDDKNNNLTSSFSLKIFNKNSKNKNVNNSFALNSSQNSINSSINYSASSKNIHSYLKKTALTRHREKETKQNKIKMEKEFQSIEAQRERKGLELNKKKILEEKEIFIKKIKEDKIIQKEKEKNKKEEEIKYAKNKYEKMKKEKEEVKREKKLEKEKDKINKIINKQNEKEKINQMKIKINKEREKEIANVKIKKEKEKEKEKEREKQKEKIKEEKAKEFEKEKEKVKEEKFLKEKEQEEKIKEILLKNKANKEKEKMKKNFSPQKKVNLNIKKEDLENDEKNKEIKSLKKSKMKKEKTNKNDDENDNKIKEKNINVENENEEENEKELISKSLIKEEIKNKYLNNPKVYRCLKCKNIPKININEYNQEIEVICEDSYYDNLHHNISTYKTFQIQNSNFSIKENIICIHCNKSLNQLTSEDMIYYCPSCSLFFCSKDELNHKNQYHQNYFKLKNIYKKMYEQNNKINQKPLNRRGSITHKVSNINNEIIKPVRRLSLKNNNSKTEINKNKEKMNKEETPKNCFNSEKKIRKIPIYLIDTFCFIHNERFNSYCHNCHKDICHICQKKEHDNHCIENYDEILLDEEELNKKKFDLNNVKNNLLKINDYFIALIEAAKCRFEKLYQAKQKELEIKEKIINDYETIKYNYNCIINIKNLQINNKQSFINSTNNFDWFNRLNLIFEYLNSSLISKNCDVFQNLKNINNTKIINFNKEKIKNIINLYNNDICISNSGGELLIYNHDTFKEKLKIKIFKEGEGINYMIKLKNNLIACCGYEKIKFVQIDLYNETYSINKIFEEKGNNFFSLIEFNNEYLVSSGSSKKIQFWINSEEKIIKKNINSLNEQLKENEDIDMIYKLKPFSFICCSFNSKKIFKYILDRNKELKYVSKIDNIKVIKGNKSILNIENNLLICYKNNLKDFGIAIINNNKFEIISQIKSINPFCFINISENENIITIDKKGIIQKWKYDKNEIKLYECDKIYHPLNNYNNFSTNKKLKSYISINNNISIFQYKNGIICLS